MTPRKALVPIIVLLGVAAAATVVAVSGFFDG